MRVYLAEKASQAADLAQVLDSGYQREDGFISLQNGDLVTWCHGHLLSLAEPDYYDPNLKRWDIKTLPFIPAVFEWLPVADKRSRKQLKTACDCIVKADEVVVSTDFDREGQLIAMNVLNHCNFSGDMYRLKLSALDTVSIQRALNSIEPIANSEGLYQSAIARSYSDWIIGLNLTRLFTCLASTGAGSEVINIGRILTPTVNLVCQRDLAIKNFKPQDFYEVNATVSVQNGSFLAKWKCPEEFLDKDGHLFDIKTASRVMTDVKGKNAEIANVERSVSNEMAPMPFSLSKLQIYAARHFNFSASKTLEICQSLYEKKLTTYPRSDSQYLPESQFDDARTILDNLALNPEFEPLVKGCDLTKRPRCYNDKKMQGHSHNAIVPCLEIQNNVSLTPDEIKIYNIVCLYYIAQFYAPAQYNVLEITVNCGEHTFSAKGRTLIRAGYRVIFHQDQFDDDSNQPKKKNDSVELSMIPDVNIGERAFVSDCVIDTKRTRAPKHFDEASLIEAMTNVGKYVDDAEQKKILNQTLGLGTEASRATIIENLKKYHWIDVIKDHYEATQKAYSTMDILPYDIKSPAMTAMWEMALDNIVLNENETSELFVNNIVQWLNEVFAKCTTPEAVKFIKRIAAGTKKSDAPVFNCEKCSSPLRLLKGKFGLFFLCTNENCKQTYQERNKRPLPLYDEQKAPKCPKCGSPMKQGQSQKGTLFWKCQNTECAIFLDDLRGKPVLPEKCPECGGFVFHHKGEYGPYWKCEDCKKNYKDLAGKPLLITPKCPICNGLMRYIDKNKSGTKITPFFSCVNYPACRGTLDKHGNLQQR